TPPETVSYVGADKTHFEDIEVATDTAYDYTLIAVDLDGLESWPSTPVTAVGLGYEWHASASPRAVRLSWHGRPDEGFVRPHITRTRSSGSERPSVTATGELRDADVSAGQTYRYRIQLERSDGLKGPPSQPILIDVPRGGSGFVEIQPPPPRIPQPDGNPR